MSAVHATDDETEPLRPAQRAAIIISLLGEEAARPLLEKLDDGALDRVQAELQGVAMLPRDHILDVVREFMIHLNGSTARFYYGKNQAKSLVTGIVESRMPPEIDEDELDQIVIPEPKPEKTIWDLMAARPAKSVADYLVPMTPNIIAKILRKLPPGISSEVLNRLDSDKLQSVLERLIQTEEEDSAMDSILARMVELEFMSENEGHTDSESKHYESVAEILSLIPSGKRDGVFAYLQREHEDELRSIQKSLFTIDALPEILNPKSVPVLFKEINATDMINYMSAINTIDADVSEFILSNISSRMAEQFRYEVHVASGTLSEKAIARYERDFLAKLFDLKRTGKIDIIKPDSNS